MALLNKLPIGYQTDELGGSRKERVNHWEPEWVNQIGKERVAENGRGRERM